MKTIDIGQKIDAIKKKYGRKYYLFPEAILEVKEFWGNPETNKAGVVPFNTETLYRKGLFRAELKISHTEKGYFLYGLSVSTSQSGKGFAPSIWNRTSYLNYHDARLAAVDDMLHFFENKDIKKSEIKAIIKVLKSERTPQLDLFILPDHYPNP